VEGLESRDLDHQEVQVEVVTVEECVEGEVVVREVESSPAAFDQDPEAEDVGGFASVAEHSDYYLLVEVAVLVGTLIHHRSQVVVGPEVDAEKYHARGVLAAFPSPCLSSSVVDPGFVYLYQTALVASVA